MSKLGFWHILTILSENNFIKLFSSLSSENWETFNLMAHTTLNNSEKITKTWDLVMYRVYRSNFYFYIPWLCRIKLFVKLMQSSSLLIFSFLIRKTSQNRVFVNVLLLNIITYNNHKHKTISGKYHIPCIR